jgi:4-amino-4-deoxy-L-arabinose transferase-like glycosyltransferase
LNQAREISPPAPPRLGARLVFALYLLAVAARLAVAGVTGFQTPRFGDWKSYVGSARILVATGSYPPFVPDGLFFRAPGYPVFLAIATAGHPDRIAWDKAVGIAAAGWSAPLLALLSARLFGRRRLAIATGTAGALYPPFLLFSADLESETLFLPLLLVAAILLLAAADHASAKLGFLSGVALALAALTRPSALALVPLLAAPLLDTRWKLARRGGLVATALLGALLTLAPWTIRNYIRYGEFIPVSDEGGCAFFDGNSDWANRLYELTDRREVWPMNIEMKRDKLRRLAAMGILPGTPAFASPSKRSLALVQTSLEDRRRDPAGTLPLFARKLWHWARPYPMLFWSLPIVISATVLYSALYFAAFVGLKTAERRGAVWFSIAVLGSSTAVHVLILVLWRYRVPYWDPILLLYGAAGAATLIPDRTTATPAQSSSVTTI